MLPLKKASSLYPVGLDVRMIQNSGIGTYLRGLLSGFGELGLENELALFGATPAINPVILSEAKNLKRDPSAKPQDDGKWNTAQDDGKRNTGQDDGKWNMAQENKKIKFTAPIYSIQEQLQYPALLRQCRLWHAPHYNVPLWKGKTKLVVTIHDIIHWIFRKQFFTPVQGAYAGFMLRRAIASADHIITDAQHTKKDLVEHFRADPEKITAIPLGMDRGFRELTEAELAPAFEALRVKYSLPKSFFLYVGLMKPHKNVLWLIRIFRKLKAEGKVRAALVLVGRKDKRYPKEQREMETLTSNAEVIHLPKVDSGELLVLYNQALALIHPSLYEGFGLTPLEAMACGTPVITTRAASLPEVVGDAAVLVETETENSIRDAIVRLDQDAELRGSLRQKGLERVKLFHWSETARKTAEVYEMILKTPS